VHNAPTRAKAQTVAYADTPKTTTHEALANTRPPPGHRKPRQVQAPPQTKAAEHGSIHPTRRGNLYKKHLQEKKNKSMKITNKNKETHSHPHETTRRNNSESPPTIPPTPPTKQPTQKTPTSKTNQQGQPIKTNNGTPTIPHQRESAHHPNRQKALPQKTTLKNEQNKNTKRCPTTLPHQKTKKQKRSHPPRKQPPHRTYRLPPLPCPLSSFRPPARALPFYPFPL